MSSEYNVKYDNTTKIEYICIKHPNIIQTITKVKFDIGRRCRQCGIEKNSGSTHYNYQGGISALNNYLRGLLRPLIDEKLKEYNYKCYITGKNATLEVHHLYNFNKIVKDILKKLKLDIRNKVEDYNEDESDDGSEDKCIYSKYRHEDDNDDIISCFDRTLGTSSLYDTLIFDKTNKLILKTIESKNSNSYRITINTSGEFELNVVGDKRVGFAPIFINKDDKIIPHFEKLHVVPV